MRYLSCKELSSIWRISTRRIQQFCVEGKIESACKVGNAWIIDENAKKPLYSKKASPFVQNFLITDSIMFKYGKIDSTLENLPPSEKAQAMHEIDFFRGNFGNAYGYFLSLPSNHKFKICAMNLVLLEAIALGNLDLVKEISTQQSKFAENYTNDIIVSSVLSFTKKLIDSSLSNEIYLTSFDSILSLPKNLIRMSLWINCRINLYNKRYITNVETLEAFLLISHNQNEFYIFDIYLTLMCGISHYMLRDNLKAKYFITKSLSMGKSDKIILPYSNFLPLVGNMLEKLTTNYCIDVLAKIKHTSETLQYFYFCIYPFLLEKKFSSNFNIKELQIIAHKINDFSNKEIANILNLSTSYVKKYMEVVYEKLYVNNKKEMKNLFKIN